MGTGDGDDIVNIPFGRENDIGHIPLVDNFYNILGIPRVARAAIIIINRSPIVYCCIDIHSAGIENVSVISFLPVKDDAVCGTPHMKGVVKITADYFIHILRVIDDYLVYKVGYAKADRIGFLVKADGHGGICQKEGQVLQFVRKV